MQIHQYFAYTYVQHTDTWSDHNIFAPTIWLVILMISKHNTNSLDIKQTLRISLN